MDNKIQNMNLEGPNLILKAPTIDLDFTYYIICKSRIYQIKIFNTEVI